MDVVWWACCGGYDVVGVVLSPGKGYDTATFKNHSSLQNKSREGAADLSRPLTLADLFKGLDQVTFLFCSSILLQFQHVSHP